MTKGRKDTIVRDQIQARIRQGDDPREIASEMAVSLSTVYDVRRKDMGIVGKSHTLSLPPGVGSDWTQERVAIQLTEEEMSQLSPRGEAVVVASMIQQDSLKKRLLRTIVEQGPFDDVLSLMRATRTGRTDSFGSHEVTHILKESLNKQGLVRYRLNRGNSGAGAIPTNITATEDAYKYLGIPERANREIQNKAGAHPPGWSRQRHAVGKDMTEPRYHDTRSATVVGATVRSRVTPVVQSPPQPLVVPVGAPAPIKEAGSYPILTMLRESFAARAEADARASRMADAAALIEADDPEEAQRLLDKAVALSPVGLSDLEKEYLQFAEDHRG